MHPTTLPLGLMGTRSCTKGHSSCLGKRSKRALNPVASAQVPCWARPKLSESKVLGPPQPHPPPSITSSPSHFPNKVSKISRQVSRAPAQAPAEMPKAMRSPTHSLTPPPPPACSLRWESKVKWDFPEKTEVQAPLPTHLSHCFPLFHSPSWK